MAEEQFAIAVSEVHAIAPAIAEILAILTFISSCPLSVSIHLIAVFPHLHEVVFIDVALMIVSADAGAGTDAAVCQYGASGDASVAKEKVIAHLSLKVA